MSVPTAGWYSTPADPQVVRWSDGTEWQNRYASVLETGAKGANVIEQIYDLKRMNIDSELQARLEIAELKKEISRLNEERSKPATDVLTQVEFKKAELLAIGRQTENALQALEELRVELTSAKAAHSANDPIFPTYTTAADNSAEAMSEIRELRKAAKASVRSGEAYSFTARRFTSEEGYDVSLPEWQAESIARELINVYNRHVEIVASKKTGDYDTVAIHQTYLTLSALAWEVGIDMSRDYHDLRTKELELLSLHWFMKNEERENARYERAEAREEAAAQRELEKEKAKLEKDLEHHFNAMAALQRKGDQHGVARLAAAIAELERKIEDIDLRALNIKTGYVYVISNIGAFGPGIVKIGLTRRLDPLDRISELSSASVPYRFDVHALFFAEDAVGIEKMLHQHFDDRRVNLVNKRKEFFRATPADVLAILQQHQVELIDWADEPSAFEYRLGLQRSAAPLQQDTLQPGAS